MSLLWRLEESALEHVAQCGGKAARLGEAMRLGCPVPQGAVLSTELYYRFMQQGGLQGEVVSILTAMQPTTMHQFQAAEWAIQSAFQVRRVPQDVREAIAGAVEMVGGLPVAVRSSATNEDGPEQSFVGQYATGSLVNSLDDLVAAVVSCWMSLFSAKALSYAHRFGVDLLRSAMAVLIQRTVQPSAQGTLFTADPISGSPDVFLLEVERGEGKDTVYRLDPYREGEGEPPLSDELKRYGLLLDEHFGAYQALEWAQEDDRLWLLRVRPATHIPAYLPVRVRVDMAQGRDPLRLVSPRGVSPRALSPYSWYHRSRSRNMRNAYFARVTRQFSPYSGRDDYYLRGYLYTRWRRFPLASDDSQPAQHFLANVMRVIAARRLDHEFRTLWRVRRPRLSELAQTDIASLRHDLLSKYIAELQGINEAFLEEAGRLGDSPSMLAALLRQIHQDWLGDDADVDILLYTGENQRAQAEHVLCGQLRAASSPQQQESIFQEFWNQYRHLYLDSNPVTEMTDICALMQDQKAALRVYSDCLGDEEKGPIRRHQDLLARRAEAERRAMSRLSRGRRLVYRYLLDLARRYEPLTLDMYEPIMLGLLLEHDAVLEVGRRLVDLGLAERPQDGSFLGDREIKEFLEPNSDRKPYAALVRERREHYRRWLRYSPPAILTEEQEVATQVLPEQQGLGPLLRGRAVSRGVSMGRVHLVFSVGEAAQVLPGEILVCEEALFELSPLFGVVSGIVAERGNLLDHAATLVREYGIPGVFGVEEATTILHDGDQVVVDGLHGTVQVIQLELEWPTI